MSFAVVLLKYMPKKTFIVPISWIKNYMPTHLPTVEFYCFISTNLKDDPNFQSKYYMKFNGTAGLFKVFILTVTDSVIDAITYQEQKRIKLIPQKFRQPGNTDAELSVENSKRKKKEKIIKKEAQQNAKTKNMAHLAVLLSDAPTPTKNFAAQNFVPEVNNYNVRIDEPQNDSLTDAIPTQVVKNGIEQKQAIVTPVDAIMTRKPTNHVRVPKIVSQKQSIEIPVTTKKMSPNAATGSESPPSIHSYDSSTVAIQPNEVGDMPPNNTIIFETGIENQLTSYLYDSSTVGIQPNEEGDMQPNNTRIFETGIEGQPIIISFETGIQNEAVAIPIELPYGTTNNRPDIVRLALEGISSASVSEFDFLDEVDEDFTDEYVHDINVGSESGQNMSTTALVDVNLNNCNFGKNQEIPDLSTLTSSVPTQKKYEKENTLPMQERHDVSSQEINYKKAYLQLKEKNASLDERNLALQNALVAADKALGTVPEVPFAVVDDGRLYKEGVFLDEFQCKILDTTSDINKYVNNLAVAVFGTETLKNSSVTGTASKNKRVPAKPGLNPLWLQLVYDLVDAKSNKRMRVPDVNKILNKKISNLNGAQKRKLTKLNGEAKRKSNEQDNKENNDVSDGSDISPNAMHEPTATCSEHLPTTTI